MIARPETIDELEELIERRMAEDALAANKLRRLREAGMEPRPRRRRVRPALAFAGAVLAATAALLAMAYGTLGLALLVSGGVS